MAPLLIFFLVVFCQGVESHETNNKLDLRLQLLSNWGHAQRIGLTEIQLYDSQRCRIPVKSSNIHASGAHSQRGELANLFNNKYKVSVYGPYQHWQT